jgi:hypothetical protein
LELDLSFLLLLKNQISAVNNNSAKCHFKVR